MENSYRIRSGKTWPLFLSLLLLAACEKQAETVTIDEEPSFSFELYQSLAGKMARMEELLNSIERFLGSPDFQERLVSESEEFRQLVEESRLLFPEELSDEDERGYTGAMDRTLQWAVKLKRAITSQDLESANEALSELHRIRKKSHARFSY